MANKLLFRIALLLSLGAIVMGGSDSTESSEKGSGSKESGEKVTTAAPAEKADVKAIEKLFLGTFKLQSDPKAKDFQEFLTAMEYKKPQRNMIKNVKEIELKIKKIKSMKYEIVVSAGGMEVQKNKFTIGKEFDDQLFDKRKYKATVTFEGKNKVVRDEKHASGFNCHNVMTFTKKGFTVDLDCKGVKAKQEFKKK